MGKAMRDRSLGFVLLVLFLGTWAVQGWSGWQEFQAEQTALGETAAFWGGSGYVWAFLQATTENWQSEFLQLLTFVVLTGFLLWRGKFVSSNHADGKKMDDYSRRMTQWLFTPTVAALRADPRFPKLCDEFGLTAYWRARNVRPDYQTYP